MAGDDSPQINQDKPGFRPRTGFGRDEIYPDL